MPVGPDGILFFAESDSDEEKALVQTRHTQTAFSSLDRKNYRQNRSKMYRPDDSQFSCLKNAK